MSTDTVNAWRETYTESARASTWLEAHRWTYGPQVAHSTVQDVRQKLELQPRDELMEVGCGSGAFLLAVLHPGQRAVGLDLCEPLVRSASRWGVDAARIKLGVAEATSLPVPDESFDKVLCYSVAHHFPDQSYSRDAVHELVRVCRVGGIVLLGDICGVMERHRRMLIKAQVPEPLADGMLAAIAPLRYFRWLPARRQSRRWSATFRRGFFGRVLRSLPCRFEFLDQNIPGRDESRGRFDLRIRKCGPVGRLRGKINMFLVASWHGLESLFPNLGFLTHG